jgi:hypothetical protein
VSSIFEPRVLAGHVLKARHLLQVPGRKTDLLDVQWIQQLPPDRQLRGALRPDEDLCALRAGTRHRDTLRRDRVAHGLRRQNALPLMNVQRINVISEIIGVTKRQIIRAMVRGEHAPHTLARLVYHLRTYRQDDGNPGAGDHEAAYQDRASHQLKRQARQLGLDLVPVTPYPCVVAEARTVGVTSRAIVGSSCHSVRSKQAVIPLGRPTKRSGPRTTFSAFRGATQRLASEKPQPAKATVAIGLASDSDLWTKTLA